MKTRLPAMTSVALACWSMGAVLALAETPSGKSGRRAPSPPSPAPAACTSDAGCKPGEKCCADARGPAGSEGRMLCCDLPDTDTCTPRDMSPAACTEAEGGQCAAGEVRWFGQAGPEGVCRPAAECPGAAEAAQAAVCSLSGSAGAVVKCPLRLARSRQADRPATALQFVMSYDGAVLRLDKLVDQFCAGPSCLPWEIPPQSTLQPTGHSVAFLPAHAESWSGRVGMVVYHGADPTKPITETYMVGSTPSGDATFAEAQFTLLKAVDAGNPAKVTLGRLVGADAATATLKASVQKGVIVTSP